ncbi:hypothetical protein [Olleya sp. UBA1516]|uniref:hypothetical protein n=1 Tax=Olleya sp. UBA1516 TaxID=1947013 RepID=UPI0025DE0244|nr:hypothetical protein [Olleya sp. UBA1516]|tara:strand:- start:3733 stop:4653 length:921 start_codon:yes stop_codon:yes gene_type:complete
MTSQELSKILQQPQLINTDQTDLLDSIIKEFPYFQSARAIYLKGLKNKESFKYNQALKTTAAYTTDRSILFDFITSETFNQNEVSEYIKHNLDYINSIEVVTEDISASNITSHDATLNQHIEDARHTINPELFQPKTENNKFEDSNLDTVKTNNDTEKAEAILKIGTPLQFEKSETHSFNEWLNLAQYKPIERETVDKKTTNATAETEKSNDINEIERAKKFELIDKFITKNPKLEAKKSNISNHNIAKEQMIQPESLMTETLARIYVEQKNYKKAIQSYKILSLKYPEKSGFFADQIKAIEKLQE